MEGREKSFFPNPEFAIKFIVQEWIHKDLKSSWNKNFASARRKMLTDVYQEPAEDKNPNFIDRHRHRHWRSSDYCTGSFSRRTENQQTKKRKADLQPQTQKGKV